MATASDAELSRAKALEASGDIDAAIPAYMKAGHAEDAARLLVAAGRFMDAAQVFLRAAAIPPERLDKDDRDRRRMYRNAAVCLARGGETRKSAELLLRLGDPLKAAEVLERGGDIAGAAHLRGGGKALLATQASPAAPPSARSDAGHRLEKDGKLDLALEAYLEARLTSDAARVAHKLGRFADAARMFEDGGMFPQAAKCWLDAGDKRNALQNLVRVPREHKQYRKSCVRAIALAAELGQFGLELDRFLSRFCADPPADAAEVEAFAQLGGIYERSGFPDNAQEVYRKLLSTDPAHAVQKRLRELEADQRGSNVAYAEILKEDAQFLGRRGTREAARDKSAKSGGDAGAVEWPSLPPPPPAPIAAKAAPAAAKSPSPDNPPKAAPSPEPSPKSAEILSPEALKPGFVIAERYRIEARIGQGGMASIFRAFDTELEEDVALKVFTVPIEDPQMLVRFKQELAVARKLSHPNIVRLHDIGVDRGCRFITMELLTGRDMSKLLEERELPLHEGLGLVIQACQGLQCAHDHGVVHRDVKPENFFVTPAGMLKVMDFGIAKNTALDSKTRTGFLAGTPFYMSPEQIDGFGHVTALTDLYALGVVLYETCTGLLPFTHEELVPLLMMHKNSAPQPPQLHNAAIPDSLNAVIMRLLEKDPKARIQTCRELWLTLERIRNSELEPA